MMKLPFLAAAAVAVFPMLATAQQVQLNDDGSPVNNVVNPGPSVQAPGSLTTTFASNNQFAGNMVDIAPVSDMQITAIDVNTTGPGTNVSIDVWYRSGTSFGFENSSTGWTFLGNYTGVSAGQNLPTNIDMTGNGMTFTGGQTYGLYFDLISYSAGVQALRYTDGSISNNTWSNADLTITANCGKSDVGFSGLTFYPRDWNGTIYYDTAGLSLTISSFVAGASTTVATAGSNAGDLVIVGYSFAGGGPTNTPYGVVDLTLPITQLPSQVADGSGETSAVYNIPSGAAGRDIWVQAVSIDGGGNATLSNSYAETIL